MRTLPPWWMHICLFIPDTFLQRPDTALNRYPQIMRWIVCEINLFFLKEKTQWDLRVLLFRHRRGLYNLIFKNLYSCISSWLQRRPLRPQPNSLVQMVTMQLFIIMWFSPADIRLVCIYTSIDHTPIFLEAFHHVSWAQSSVRLELCSEYKSGKTHIW